MFNSKEIWELRQEINNLRGDLIALRSDCELTVHKSYDGIFFTSSDERITYSAIDLFKLLCEHLKVTPKYQEGKPEAIVLERVTK